MVADVDGEFRIRLSSTEPLPVISKIIPIIKDNPKVCRFLHLPIQYAENDNPWHIILHISSFHMENVFGYINIHRALKYCIIAQR